MQGQIVLGVDPGKNYTPLAVLEDDGRQARILRAEIVRNEDFELFLNDLLASTPVALAAVERTSKRPWTRRLPKGELRRVRAVGGEMASALARHGIPVVRPLPSRLNAWYGGAEPGWRQQLTGLMRPWEQDVFHHLLNLARSGRIVSRIPRHLGIADAVGLAFWAATAHEEIAVGQ